MTYHPVIGLEVHVELKTASKMFCRCSADYFGKEPNTHTCPVCLGLPGALPVPNKKAIEWCIMIGQALSCDIPLSSKFDRKNYFYPDLAKGYQISQYDEPFCLNGFIEVQKDETSQEMKKIRIRRVHMEEDTGKLIHGQGATFIDFNRSGVPLVEIVTEPDFENAYQVVQYLKKLQQIVRYLNVSNADMEKGDMRLEPNISLKKETTASLPNYKVEVKNINSFRFVEKAITYEIKRQGEILDKGDTPLQETRGFNEAKNNTVSQRMKEEANDYRYFPEPDIPPFRWETSFIKNLKSHMPELPDEKRARFISDFSLTPYDAEILTREKNTADFFEEAVGLGKEKNITPKHIANTIINKKVDTKTVSVKELIKQLSESTHPLTVDEEKLTTLIETTLSEQQKAVEEYKNGKTTVIMFLVGQVMRQYGQKIDAQIVRQKLESALTK